MREKGFTKSFPLQDQIKGGFLARQSRSQRISQDDGQQDYFQQPDSHHLVVNHLVNAAPAELLFRIGLLKKRVPLERSEKHNSKKGERVNTFSLLRFLRCLYVKSLRKRRVQGLGAWPRRRAECLSRFQMLLPPDAGACPARWRSVHRRIWPCSETPFQDTYK